MKQDLQRGDTATVGCVVAVLFILVPLTLTGIVIAKIIL